jgi:hypothetical protein
MEDNIRPKTSIIRPLNSVGDIMKTNDSFIE